MLISALLLLAVLLFRPVVSAGEGMALISSSVNSRHSAFTGQKRPRPRYQKRVIFTRPPLRVTAFENGDSDDPPSKGPRFWTRAKATFRSARRVSTSIRTLPFFFACPPITKMFDFVQSVKNGQIKIALGLPKDGMSFFGLPLAIKKVDSSDVAKNGQRKDEVEENKLSPSIVYDEIPVFDKYGNLIGVSYVRMDASIRNRGTVREFLMDSVSLEKKPYHPLTAYYNKKNTQPTVRIRTPNGFEKDLRRKISKHETDQKEFISRRLERMLERAIPFVDNHRIMDFAARLPAQVQQPFLDVFGRDGESLKLTRRVVHAFVEEIKHLIHDISFLPIINQVSSGLHESLEVLNQKAGFMAKLNPLLNQKQFSKDLIQQFHPIVMQKMETHGLDLMADYYSVQLSYHVELKMRAVLGSVLDRVWSKTEDEDEVKRRVFQILQPVRPMFRTDLWSNLFLEEAIREHGADNSLPALALANRKLKSKSRPSDSPDWSPIPVNFTALVSSSRTEHELMLLDALTSLLQPLVNVSLDVLVCLMVAFIQSISMLLNKLVHSLFGMARVRKNILGLVESLLMNQYRGYMDEADLPERVFSRDPEDDPPVSPTHPHSPIWVDIE